MVSTTRLRRGLAVAAATLGVAAGLLAGAAAPASAAGESFNAVSPSSLDPGAPAQEFTFALTLATQNTWNANPTIGGYYLMLPGFDYSALSCADVTFTPSLATDAAVGLAGACDTFEAGKGLHFTGPYIDSTPTREYTITIAGLTPPQTEGCYLVGLGNWDASEYLGGVNLPVGTTCDAAPPAPPAPQVITIRIDGNGGSCRTTEIASFEGSWRTAPEIGDCSRDRANFLGFNTSANGSGLWIAPGGNLHLTGDNTLYAQWLSYVDYRPPAAPTGVKVVPGRNVLHVSWTAPTDPGVPAWISNYLASSQKTGGLCITRQTDADMLACSFSSPAGVKTNVGVQALNGAGWGVRGFSAETQSWNIELTGASRAKRVLGLWQEISAEGVAPGLPAGTEVILQFSYLNSESATPGSWANMDRARVGQNGKFSAEAKLPRERKKAITAVRFLVQDPVTKQYEATHYVVRLPK